MHFKKRANSAEEPLTDSLILYPHGKTKKSQPQSSDSVPPTQMAAHPTPPSSIPRKTAQNQAQTRNFGPRQRPPSSTQDLQSHALPQRPAPSAETSRREAAHRPANAGLASYVTSTQTDGKRHSSNFPHTLREEPGLLAAVDSRCDGGRGEIALIPWGRAYWTYRRPVPRTRTANLRLGGCCDRGTAELPEDQSCTVHGRH